MLKVYITDLAAYNAGFLIGEWVSLPMDTEEINTIISNVLRKGAEACREKEHEEYFITDFEFEDTELFKVGEYSNIEEINSKCEELNDLDENDRKKVAFLINDIGCDFEDALNCYEDVTIYEDTTLEQIAEDYIYETINMDEIPDIIKNNIDFKGIAVDFNCSGEFTKVGNDYFHYVN